MLMDLLMLATKNSKFEQLLKKFSMCINIYHMYVSKKFIYAFISMCIYIYHKTRTTGRPIMDLEYLESYVAGQV
jgi:hypothetical protein